MPWRKCSFLNNSSIFKFFWYTMCLRIVVSPFYFKLFIHFILSFCLIFLWSLSFCSIWRFVLQSVFTMNINACAVCRHCHLFIISKCVSFLEISFPFHNSTEMIDIAFSNWVFPYHLLLTLSFSQCLWRYSSELVLFEWSSFVLH